MIYHFTYQYILSSNTGKINISDYNYQHNMLLQDHHQHLREEERTTAAATSTKSAPIVSGPVDMTTLSPDTTFSVPLKIPDICSQHSHLICPWKRLPQFHIL